MNIQNELRRGEAIPRLMTALRDDDDGVRQAAAEALRGLGLMAWPDLLLALMEPRAAANLHLRRGALRVLLHGPIAAPVVAPLLSELQAFPAAIATMIAAHRLYHRLLTNRAFAARVTVIHLSERAALPSAPKNQRLVRPLDVDAQGLDEPG